MARVCQVTGKPPKVGNRVSHANNKTKRRFLPNLQCRRFWVEGENRWPPAPHQCCAADHRKNGIEAVLSCAPVAKISREEIRPWPGYARRSSSNHRPDRSLLHDRQEQEDHARKDRDQEIRSRRAQAREVQGNEAEVAGRVARFRKKQRVAAATLFVASERRARQACAARRRRAKSCRAAIPLSSALRSHACRSATSCSADTFVRVQSRRSSSRIATSLARYGLDARSAGDLRLDGVRDLVVVAMEPATGHAHVVHAAGALALALQALHLGPAGATQAARSVNSAMTS